MVKSMRGEGKLYEMSSMYKNLYAILLKIYYLCNKFYLI